MTILEKGQSNPCHKVKIMNISYWLGMYLGDGMCRREYIRKTDGSIAYYISLVVKEDHKEELIKLLGRFNIKYSVKIHVDTKGFNYYTFYSRSRKLSEFIVSTVGESISKRFPAIKTTKRCWEILSGFTDSDGNIDKDKIHLCNTNEELINSIKEYLEFLSIEYTVFKQKTKNKPCYWINIKSTELPHTRFNLRIQYKRERYEILKSRSRGRKIYMGSEWFHNNQEILKQVLPTTTYKRRFKQERWYVDEYEMAKYREIEGKFQCVGVEHG